MPHQYQLMVNILSYVSSAGVVKGHGVYWDGITLTLNCKYFTMACSFGGKPLERKNVASLAEFSFEL